MPSFLTWDDTRLAYAIHGRPDAERTVVLTNGLTCTASYWKFVLEALAPDHRIVTWDLRGHGASEPPSHPNHVRVEDLARDLLALMDFLHIPKAVWGGFSMGAEIILEAWHQAPERCEALLVVTGTYQDPVGGLFDNSIPRFVWRRVLRGAASRVPRVSNALWHNAFKLPFAHTVATALGTTGATEALMRPYYEHQTLLHVPTVFRMGAAGTRHSAIRYLPQIDVPTLVVCAREDRFTPPWLARNMRDLIPGVTYVEVPDVTHTALLEAPGVIVEAIRGTLARAWGTGEGGMQGQGPARR